MKRKIVPVIFFGALVLFQGCLDKKSADSNGVQKMQEKVKVLSMFGPPGCGKGTVASQLVNDLGFVTLSTGDLCRKHIQEGTELGKSLKAIIEKGHLAPDELITDMVVDWLKEKVRTAKNIILDGYPRTKGQAELFNKHLKEDEELKNIEFEVADFDINEDAIVKRISSRIVCPNKACQIVYNLLTNKPLHDMVCDKCGTQLIQRKDDQEKVVRERLNVFNNFKDDILDYYKDSETHVLNFEPKGDPQAVFEDFRKLVS